MTYYQPLPVESRIKQPGERRTLVFEFANKLPTGDSLSETFSVTAPVGITVGTAVRSGTQILVPISGGEDGQDYRVTCSATSVGGDIMELDVDILVRADIN